LSLKSKKDRVTQMLKLLTPKTPQTVDMTPKEMVAWLQEYFDVNIASIDGYTEIKGAKSTLQSKIVDKCQKGNGTKYFPYKKVKLGTVKQEIEKLLASFDLTDIPNPSVDKQKFAEYLCTRFRNMELTVIFYRRSNKPDYVVIRQIPVGMGEVPYNSVIMFKLNWKIRA
jgi:hypothetical protein